jgi:hypothetical protein
MKNVGTINMKVVKEFMEYQKAHAVFFFSSKGIISLLSLL